MDNTDIVNIVNAITVDVQKTNGNSIALRRCRAMCANKHRKFATNYPKLFEMCFSPAFDVEQFQFMIHQLEQMHDNSDVTFEECTQNVCTKLNDKYIVPLVGQPHKDVNMNDMNHIKFSTSREGEKEK